MFALLNFLECCGYNHELIDKIVREWNTKNQDPLKEVIINSQLRYRKQQRKETILPPNCMQAYQEINLCSPDGLCRKIKNPVQYAKTKSFIANQEANKGKRDPLTEEQKEKGRKHRAKKKEMEKNKNNNNVKTEQTDKIEPSNQDNQNNPNKQDKQD